MKILFEETLAYRAELYACFKIRTRLSALSKAIKDICGQHELSIVNFESPVTDYKKGILKDGPASAIQNSIEVLKKIGFGLFTLANNHLKDFASQGVLETFNALREHQITFFGAGRNLTEARKSFIFEQGGKNWFSECM